mmetsp:Transcript_12778/g.24929  ORF Transcript_12778/g.24929 Transcript_12778/m.24929 type:complete len:126 (-) Transcript_12778:320-697(-)
MYVHMMICLTDNMMKGFQSFFVATQDLRGRDLKEERERKREGSPPSFTSKREKFGSSFLRLSSLPSPPSVSLVSFIPVLASFVRCSTIVPFPFSSRTKRPTNRQAAKSAALEVPTHTREETRTEF